MDDFMMKASVHGRSGLRLYLFSLVMNVLIEDIQNEGTWCMIQF